MENQTYAKPMYKCALCDSIYESIEGRAKCEQSCLKKKVDEEKRAAAEKRLAEQKLRKEAVDDAIRRAAKLANDYTKDYGHYEYEGEIVENIFWPNKIWHLFR